MTPRIAPVDQPDDQQREALAKTLHGPDGEPLNIFRTLAHVPKLMGRINALGGYFMAHGRIPLREREIVILRTAAHLGCEYEIGQHRWIGEKTGLTADEVAGALDPSSHRTWSGEHAALLAFTDELVATGTVSDSAWEGLDGSYDELQRVELLVLVGFYRMLAGVLDALAVELDASVVDRSEP